MRSMQICAARKAAFCVAAMPPVNAMLTSSSTRPQAEAILCYIKIWQTDCKA